MVTEAKGESKSPHRFHKLMQPEESPLANTRNKTKPKLFCFKYVSVDPLDVQAPIGHLGRCPYICRKCKLEPSCKNKMPLLLLLFFFHMT